MNTHYRKTFTALLFILVLSFAFYFSFNQVVQAQSVQVSLCATQAGTTCLTFSGNTPALTAWLDNNVNGIKWPAIVDNNFTISLYENPNYGGQCWSYTSRSNSVTPVPYEVAGKISSLKLGPCASTAPSPTPAPGGGNGTGTGDLGPGDSDLPGIDLTIDDVANIIYGFACWLWSISMVLLVIFIIIAGLRFMYAGANPTRLADATKNFKYVIIGAIVVMGTFVIIATISYNIGVDISFVPFNCSGTNTEIEEGEPTRYGCSNQGCVENPRGGYTNPSCDNACEVPVGQTCSTQCDQAADEICSAVYPEGGSDYQQCFREEQTACCNSRPSPTGSSRFCGDGVCDALVGESASVCPSDCRASPPPSAPNNISPYHLECDPIRRVCKQVLGAGSNFDNCVVVGDSCAPAF